MSDGNAPPSRRPVGRTHEEFAAWVRRVAKEEVEKLLPRMGTVVEEGAAGVRVHLDGEKSPRQVPMARRAGQRYPVGHRVQISFSRSGVPIVTGTVLARSGEVEKVLDPAHLLTDASGRYAFAPKTIKGDDVLIENYADQDELNSAKQELRNDIQGAKNELQGKVNDADAKAQDAKNAAQTADNKAQEAKNDAAAAKSDAQDAKDEATTAKADAKKANDAIAGLKSDIEDLKRRIAKLEGGV